MHFSLLAPIPAAVSRGGLAVIGAPYAEHQWLWTLFEKPEGAPRPFIYRVMSQADGLPRIYMLSLVVPILPASSGWTVQTRDYGPQPEEGQIFAFELRANPVVTRESDRNGKKTRRREDVVMHAKTALLREKGAVSWQQWQSPDKPSLYDLVQEHGTAWLRSQGERHGFSLLDSESDLQVNNYQRQVLGKMSRNEGAGARVNDGLVLSTVDFSGRLRVQDGARFREALLNGIGHGKAFGCGLMLVRRAVDA